MEESTVRCSAHRKSVNEGDAQGGISGFTTKVIFCLWYLIYG